ncbi:hypothetical protein [Micromonospora sp. NPDC023956]|uniref:hypothetical protein n=1 Tax=Micromonospora sp. NPDC023956 TaxID=3155722 RepID=UPI0033FDE471
MSKISVIASTTTGGWTYDTYRNRAYECSLGGFQTFTIGTRVGSSATQPAPLWTYLHGGGTGYFDPSGTPQPDDNHMREETPQQQRESLIEVALTARLRSASANNRLLAVSMCNRDIYGGVGLPDPNNVTPEGRNRTTNGLLSTKAAVQFTTSRYRTNDNFLYGTSAGSHGTFHVSYGLQLQGLAPAGLVADSGVINTLAQERPNPDPACGRTDEWRDIFPRRLHPAITNGDNDPDQLVSSGALRVPVLQVWSRNDGGQCGARPMACPLRDGSTPTMGSTDCTHELLRLAIADQGPTSRSYSMRLCVSPPGQPGTCTVHTPTTDVGAVNTLPSEPADFNAKILSWVQQRSLDDRD